MTNLAAPVHVSAHFIKRARERIHPKVDPVALAEAAFAEIDAGRFEHVQFIDRQNRKGLRRFRVHLADGRWFRFVLDMQSRSAITVTGDEENPRKTGKGKKCQTQD